ncbi:hypothetical protein QA635_34295 [Bradyrhizobium brasilense]|uniref:hypothetical protein n=1 Tax=Bradyrhizobium brasilense TaxID=1419277 RepID=UPI0024B27AEB|nr:hypothetical protein [Bradyrhizobium australafricanum]WFU31544.1 hypothetical protein QA635_34295 [Bradyrhizobium australafricanum]
MLGSVSSLEGAAEMLPQPYRCGTSAESAQTGHPKPPDGNAGSGPSFYLSRSDYARELFGHHECDGQAVEHRKLLAAIVRERFLFRLDGKLLVRMMDEARLLPC